MANCTSDKATYRNNAAVVVLIYDETKLSKLY